MLNLILHSEADKEFANARIWYEEQKSGLRKRFELSVEATIKKYKLLPNSLVIQGSHFGKLQ